MFSGEGNGNPLQYSCLENPMNGGAWQAAAHGVSKSWTWLSNSLSLFTFLHWRRKWQPTPVFLPGESLGWRSLVGCCLWGCTESDMTKTTQQQQQHSTIYSNWSSMEEPLCKRHRQKTSNCEVIDGSLSLVSNRQVRWTLCVMHEYQQK